MKSVFNSSSSLFIFVSWYKLLLLLSHGVLVAFSLNSEGKALLSLLNKFSSASVPDSIKSSWNNLSNTTPCDWSGIGCNTEKTHVVSLNLSHYGISGQLGPHIGRLRYLKSIDLGQNKLSGPFPIELWNCSHLQHLNLSSNEFLGELPEAVRILSQLNSFDISRNNFTGSIPTKLWNCTHLQHLHLSGISFTGELPEAVGNLHQLKSFSVYSNHLSGRIPESLFQILGLESVDLSWNNFTGSIPLNIGNATNMKELKLGGNQLRRTIPTSIGNCTKLEHLGLSYNGLNGEIPLGVWRIPTLEVIDVAINNLSGELPVEMTTGLHRLKVLHLIDNHFSGLIPEALGINSTSLEIADFGNNTFSGEIPPNLCFGKQLEDLRLDQNQFHGSIPPVYTGNCHSLGTLYLRQNKLTGSLPHFEKNSSLYFLLINKNNIQGKIPSSICNLGSILFLDFSENQMNGTLPNCLGDLNQLAALILRNNDFSGTIPQNFTSLYRIDLNGNRFEGKIPLIRSPRLILLDLGNNQLDDTFPFFLEKALNLEILVLRSNKLYGPPTGFAFNKLRVLDISSNHFTGDLPLEFILGLDAMKHIPVNESFYYLGGISTIVIYKGNEMRLNATSILTFRAIDLSNNRFQGAIPESIGELLKLNMLNLSNNNFSGRMPSSLGNLKELESLDLSRNKLFGEIPWQLTNLNFLAVLNLSRNNLEGPVPNGGQFQTFTNASFDGNPGLCGKQLSRKCEDDADKESRQDRTEEKESYENSKFWNFGWEPVVIGYGCGIVIGLVIQYFVFTKASMYRWFG